MISSIVALLFASGESLRIKELAELLDVNEGEIREILPQVKTLLSQVGLAIIEHNNELQLVTEPKQGELVEKLLKKDLEGELTPATLQVLTIIAYLGKVSRQDISFIRGVQSAQSIRTLSVRGLIEKRGDDCELTLDALKLLGVTKNTELPEYETLSKDLTEKLKEARKE